MKNLVVGVTGLPTGAGSPGGATGATGTTPPAGATGTTPGAGATAAVPTPVHLGDVATVAVAQVASTGYARTDGQSSMTLSVSKGSDANTVTVADEVNAKIAEIAGAPP